MDNYDEESAFPEREEELKGRNPELFFISKERLREPKYRRHYTEKELIENIKNFYKEHGRRKKRIEKLLSKIWKIINV